MINIQNKNIIVTGGAGFLGSNVVNKLLSKGCKNVFVPRSSEFDLVDMTSVRRMFKYKQGTDIVIHLAALRGGIKANMDSPGKFFYNNLMMGVQLIEEARLNNVEKFVTVGTVCSYPKFTEPPFKEDDLWEGYPEETNAPYGLAKKALLVQSQAYRQQYNFNSIYLLPVNLYGPGDNFNETTSHVIPALIKKCVNAVRNNIKYIECWGSGSASREFLYVSDAADAIVRATEFYDGCEPVNIGTGGEISIKELVLLIADLSGFNGEIIWNTDMPDGQPRRCLDTSRAEKYFGFKAKTSFVTGLQKTIEWYKNDTSN